MVKSVAPLKDMDKEVSEDAIAVVTVENLKTIYITFKFVKHSKAEARSYF